ncbi:DUF3667 domain-containing protein [Flavobacterium tegetincola]|uniref:DUF3667 domain-containing protein n=1 Tax=Flavobacterium tegetincola TaxID=150172 RepID=UPI00040A8CB0|nr:DUF3667 domain-containing protein [Flavobacterium tegetincola]
MEATCLNCNTEIVQNFCANCGQKKYKRIDRKYIWDEVQYSTVHMNKGFFYSLKNILINPGKTARTFIDGNRVNHYKPIALAFILSGISAFIAYKLIGMGEMTAKVNAMQSNDATQLKLMKSFNDFIQTYISLFTLALLPFFALLSRWSFKSFKNNFYEHVVMNAYILSYSTLISILVIYPLLYLFKDNEAVSMTLVVLPMLSFFIILPYFYKNFYHEYSLKKILSRVLLYFVLLFASFAVIAIMLAVFGFLFAYFNPEAVKHLVPKPPAA